MTDYRDGINGPKPTPIGERMLESIKTFVIGLLMLAVITCVLMAVAMLFRPYDSMGPGWTRPPAIEKLQDRVEQEMSPLPEPPPIIPPPDLAPVPTLEPTPLAEDTLKVSPVVKTHHKTRKASRRHRHG